MKYKIFEQLFFIYRTISHGIKLKKKLLLLLFQLYICQLLIIYTNILNIR